VLAFIEITLIWHKKYTKKPTKRHYCDNIEYCDILTHDNRHQLFLISPIPTPSAKQGLSRGIPRHNHAVPPTSPCPTLSAHAKPISQGYYWKWHHKLQVSLWAFRSLVVKRLVEEAESNYGYTQQRLGFSTLVDQQVYATTQNT